MTGILDMASARVFYDGIFDTPVRLAHPEGVAVDVDGNVWCGTENGDLLRIDADGTRMQSLGTTGGFIAGIAFDPAGRLYACDIRHGCVFRLDPATRSLERFGSAALAIPNYPVVDVERNALYVSDSYSFEGEGPGVWRYDLATGEAILWYDAPLAFANGMALAPDGRSLLVVESLACRLSRIAIRDDGSAGDRESVAEGLTEFPDGVALAIDGTIFVSCYEPSQIYRLTGKGRAEVLIRDPVATLIAHPTNMAFRGTSMLTTNLGRWHITEIDVGLVGQPLPLRVPRT